MGGWVGSLVEVEHGATNDQVLAVGEVGEEGHWKGECPAYWASIDSPLPGWKKDGRKDKKAWDGANPKKETFKQWLKFIKDHFEGHGQPARVDGAPSYDDYKDRAANGAGP